MVRTDSLDELGVDGLLLAEARPLLGDAADLLRDALLRLRHVRLEQLDLGCESEEVSGRHVFDGVALLVERLDDLLHGGAVVNFRAARSPGLLRTLQGTKSFLLLGSHLMFWRVRVTTHR